MLDLAISQRVDLYPCFCARNAEIQDNPKNDLC